MWGRSPRRRRRLSGAAIARGVDTTRGRLLVGAGRSAVASTSLLRRWRGRVRPDLLPQVAARTAAGVRRGLRPRRRFHLISGACGASVALHSLVHHAHPRDQADCHTRAGVYHLFYEHLAGPSSGLTPVKDTSATWGGTRQLAL